MTGCGCPNVGCGMYWGGMPRPAAGAGTVLGCVTLFVWACRGGVGAGGMVIGVAFRGEHVWRGGGEAIGASDSAAGVCILVMPVLVLVAVIVSSGADVPAPGESLSPSGGESVV